MRKKKFLASVRDADLMPTGMLFCPMKCQTVRRDRQLNEAPTKNNIASCEVQYHSHVKTRLRRRRRQLKIKMF